VRRRARGEPLPEVPNAPSGADFDTVLTPREAFLGAGEAVPVAEAIGRVSCESIAGYPPGVPALLPGERVTAEVIEYLRELTAAGARLHGAADPTFATVRVLARTPVAVEAAAL
jgi:arginine/lysine/ornithine decarboxylase